MTTMASRLLVDERDAVVLERRQGAAKDPLDATMMARSDAQQSHYSLLGYKPNLLATRIKFHICFLP